MHVPFFGLNLFIIQSIYKRFTNESNIRIGCPIARLNRQNIRFVMLGFAVRTVVFHLAYNMIADTVFVRKPAVKLQFVGRWETGLAKKQSAYILVIITWPVESFSVFSAVDLFSHSPSKSLSLKSSAFFQLIAFICAG